MLRTCPFPACALLVVFLAAACTGSDDLTTNTASSTFAVKAEKLAFLHRYVLSTPGLLDAEYSIVYKDNSGGMVPGPSDWDIRLAAHVDPDSALAWTAGMREDTLQASMASWSELITDKDTLAFSGVSRTFRSAGKLVVMDARHVTVLARYSTMPMNGQ